MFFNLFSNEKKNEACIIQEPMPIYDVCKKISPYIQRNPSLLDDSKRLCGLLNDCFRKNEIVRNLLLIGYDEHIVSDIRKIVEYNESTFSDCKTRLMNNNSLDETIAIWITVAWFNILGRNVPAEITDDLDQRFSVQLTEDEIESYGDKYSEEGFWNKVTGNVKSIGGQLLYKAMQLYYATENPACPLAVKMAIYGALGYFIAPLDAIADFVPVVGYTDDAAAIATALVLAESYIDEEVRFKAKSKLQDLFGSNILQIVED